MDPDFNDPLPEGGASVSSSSDADESVVMSLVDNLGCFTTDQVRAAVKHCDGAADRAADWLFSHSILNKNVEKTVGRVRTQQSTSGGQ